MLCWEKSSTFCAQSIDIDPLLSDVLSRIGGKYHKCRLGFTPVQEDMHMCIAERYDGSDDYRLFYRGQEMESIEREKLYFPELSHA